jgi:hypothetical protein
LKPFQEWKDGGIKESNERVNASMIYLMHYTNFYKCHNVPPPSTTIKNKQKLKTPSGEIHQKGKESPKMNIFIEKHNAVFDT